MSLIWLLFIVIQLISVTFMGISIMRLYGYVRKYRFNESNYTLLLGFIHLNWVATAYIVAVPVWAVLSFFFLFH
ncbi:hypothetical protein CO046_03810 [Candidatus Peregrinibacteria bacterium CG_4_9_14_0_2_um_filter_53_11]|nr:MAG: hypothetical protein CO046_03810 [Candidatus Peregrinibacteria bacterium CG_4_9_14_0_2_um_filter_53_11]